MEKKYFITLTGAKKNIGDFLITDRCEHLLDKLSSEFDFIKFPHWKNLDENLEIVNNSCGIIIFGGPGYQKNMYPGVYKLTKNLDDIKVPIIPLGIGWKGIPGDIETLKDYKFNSSSIKLLKKMTENNREISCRDYYTAEVLELNGIKNVKMTGCPVWYNLEFLGSQMNLTSDIKKIVFTPAQLKEFSGQSIETMKLLKKMFPKAEIYCSFHRGIGIKDEFTPNWDAENTKYLAQKAKEIGLIPVDTAFDLEKLSFYKDCDLHVGYRVHAHINFLSMRRPSILIHEDGRGRGVSEALNIKGIDGFKRVRSKSILDTIPKIRLLNKKLFPFLKNNNNCVTEVEFQLKADLTNSFVRYSGVGKIIDENYKIMERYIVQNINKLD